MKNAISIVVPHKNTPDKLARLLRSIPAGEGVEVIVVDDDSASDKKRIAWPVPSLW